MKTPQIHAYVVSSARKQEAQLMLGRQKQDVLSEPKTVQIQKQPLK